MYTHITHLTYLFLPFVFPCVYVPVCKCKMDCDCFRSTTFVWFCVPCNMVSFIIVVFKNENEFSTFATWVCTIQERHSFRLHSNFHFGAFNGVVNGIRCNAGDQMLMWLFYSTSFVCNLQLKSFILPFDKMINGTLECVCMCLVLFVVKNLVSVQNEWMCNYLMLRNYMQLNSKTIPLQIWVWIWNRYCCLHSILSLNIFQNTFEACCCCFCVHFNESYACWTMFNVKPHSKKIQCVSHVNG